MPFTDKSKPGFFASLFTRKAPMPTSPLSSGTKDIGPDDAEGAENQAGPTSGQPASNGLFANRRAARRAAGEVVDSEVVAEAQPAASTAASDASAKRPASAASRLGSMLNNKKAKVSTESSAAAGARSAAAMAALRPKAKTATSDRVVLLTELENGRSLTWELTRTSFKQLEAADATDGVLSFSKEDIRLVASKTMPYAKALDTAIEDVGEMVAIVNRSRDLRTLYATREERPTALLFRLGPGQQALDALLQKTDRLGQSLITGFMLKDPSANLSVAILFHVSPEGSSTKPQITVNPDNMEFVLTQFAAARKINRKETEVHLFGNDDLLSVAGLSQYYPNEKVWNGIPIRVLTNIGAALSGVAAAGCLVWTATGYISQVRMNADLEKTKTEIKQVSDKNNKTISNSLHSFAANASLDDTSVFTNAGKLWLPESRIVVTADADKTTFSIVMPLSRPTMFHNGPSVTATTDDQAVQRLYALTPPDGCTKETISTSGSFNEIRVNVVCQGSAGALSRFRND